MINFQDNSAVVHKSKPPLRWIANWAGSRASKSLLSISYMEDDGVTSGFKYKLNCEIWDNLWPIYEKYGTYYTLDTDMSGPAWDDYDENGIAYWEKTGTVDPEYHHWDYVDEETSDAFRIIKNGHL